MFLQALDLTTALRPELLPDETLLCVQDGVGLYEGKFKIPNLQHGHVYLTSHRICYVDKTEPRTNSTAIELKNVDGYDFYAGFLKSSAKITLHPKASKRLSIQSRPQNPHESAAPSLNSPSRSATASPYSRATSSGRSPSQSHARPPSITWVCPICSFSNILPSYFDASTANEHTPLPACQTCGIKPELTHILKAAIASSSARNLAPQLANLSSGDGQGAAQQFATSSSQTSYQCPRCTYNNHPSLLSCEICGASLVSPEDRESRYGVNNIRDESPGPSLDQSKLTSEDSKRYIKVSFRGGGEKIFYERLKGAMVQRKWLLQQAPPIPQPQQSPLPSFERDANTTNSSGRGTPDLKGVGIAGLERLGFERRKNNEIVISSAFEDLEALMASAKEIVAIAESFAGKTLDYSAETLLHESVANLGMATTKDLLGPASGSESLYVSELSRNLAEYLTDDRRGVLKREGGIMSLVDLWATFNSARNGVELVSPADFEKAARLWEKLALPVRLREFKNGLLVVQAHDWTDEKTIAQLLAWLRGFKDEKPREETSWDWKTFGKGVTAQETATRFGWSVGVATEELDMAEDRGILCREESIEGLRFWENWILQDMEEPTN